MTDNDLALERAAIESLYGVLHAEATRIIASGVPHQPILITITSDGDGSPCGFVPQSLVGIDKSIWGTLVSALLSQRGVGVVVLISESMCAFVEKGDPLVEAVESGRVAISDIPDSRETLVIQIATCAHNVWVSLCPIERAEDGSRVLRDAPLKLVGGEAEEQWSGSMLATSSVPDGATRH